MLYVLGLLMIIASVAALAFLWRRDALSVRLEGHDYYEHLQTNDPDNPLAALDRRSFVGLYERANRERKPKYAIAFLALAAAGTLPVLMILSALRGLVPLGPLTWGFVIFFLVILWWVGALWIALRYYHRRRPGTLEEEFRKSRV